MEMHEFDLLNLEEKNSLVRKYFNKKFSLNDFDVKLYSPMSFKNKSFFPKNGLDLGSLSDVLKKGLDSIHASPSYVKETIPGVIEAVKNAYEHGNQKDNSKEIILLEKLGKKEISYLVGDEGGQINGNLFSYINMIRKQKELNRDSNFESFYSFCDENYAPLGHSGVGSIVMHKCFDKVYYFKNKKGGLSVLLEKSFSQMR